MSELTKAEGYRRWLARRWFRDGYGWHVADGMFGAERQLKKNQAAMNMWLRKAYVEQGEHGLFRLTDLGRDALQFPKL